MLSTTLSAAAKTVRRDAWRPATLLARTTLCLVLLLGLLLADGGAAVADEQTPFSGRWIDVNLSRLTATAYEGSQAVYSAPVTTGKKGYSTPTGTFRVLQRVRVTDMRSSPGAREYYYVKNVQYVQYFYPGGVAIHANYWAPSSVFGRTNVSHGCVSMRTAQAAYFWSFASVGTPIYVHYGSAPAVPVVAVVGSDQAAAKSQLESAGFRVTVTQQPTTLSAPGVVLDQKPGSGTPVAKGSTIALTVAVEPPIVPTWGIPGVMEAAEFPYGDPSPTTTWAPAVVGLGEAAAIARIERAGLRATYVRYVGEGEVPEGLRESVKAAAAGTVVWALETPGRVLPRGVDYLILVKRN